MKLFCFIQQVSHFKMPQQAVENNLMSAPTWLTKDYLQDKFKKRYNESNLNITNIQIKPASSKGANYTSEMLRMTVFYRIGNSTEVISESIIVKSTFSGDNIQANIMNQYGFYKREMIMYEQILPRLQALLKTIGNKDQICPRTIHVDYDHASIIFEDLNDSGFTMADRIERLDMKHAQLALNKLAKMHAAAAVLGEKSPELFAQDFDRGLFNRHTRGLKPVVMGTFDAMLRYIDSQSELKEQFYDKLLALREKIMEYCERVFDVNPNHFMTLLHGDFWHMNMMFKYASEVSKNPVDIVPLDFQCSAWASPTVDLQYFFNTSLCEELRLHHQAELVQYYYKILVNTLKELKFQGKIPSLFDFRLQLEMRSFYAFFAAFIFQPVMICPHTEDADFLNLVSETESGIRFKNTVYKNDKVQKNIAQLLPIFDKMGLLDDMDSFHL